MREIQALTGMNKLTETKIKVNTSQMLRLLEHTEIVHIQGSKIIRTGSSISFEVQKVRIWNEQSSGYQAWFL